MKAESNPTDGGPWLVQVPSATDSLVRSGLVQLCVEGTPSMDFRGNDHYLEDRICRIRHVSRRCLLEFRIA